MLQATTIFAILALFTGSVSAIYSNSTVSATTTLAPSYSLEAHETTVSYSDETTTFFATSTVYSTHWFTLNTATVTNEASSTSASGPAATASTQETIPTVTKAASSFSASGSAATASTHESISTSTITSTLLITLHDTTVLAPSSSAAASIGDDGSNNKGANIRSLDQTSTSSNGCVPITKFVTVTKEPITQYVTVTPNMTTQYVTVTGAFSAASVSTGNVQWFNTTTITN
ncbi:Srl1p [Saccharomyces eubayanus]|uniref:Srl1p n=1 Tax=Saccharomyces eubayanus TaxID=1080349 RepID=UPI0006C26B83|nr:SRL1-like protein [Saccharomyces eubayanus]KOG96730.1 SRL1-like protein [Saccharomyces eubayanus]